MKLFIDSVRQTNHLFYTTYYGSVRLGQGSLPYFQVDGLTPMLGTIYL